MKTTKYFIGLLMAFAWMGCSKEDDNKEDIKLSVSEEIFYANHFAKATLEKTYLWNEEIADKLESIDPETNEDPIATVEEVRYKQGGKEVDKWTTLTNDVASLNDSMQGVSTTYGYRLMRGKFSNTNGYFFVVAFVYNNSPAQEAGIGRGDIIVTLNGKEITDENYLDVVYAPNLTLGMAKKTEQGIVATKEINVSARSMYCDPILAHKVFDIDGKEVGYLAFSDFDLQSIEDLIDICKSFKATGVKELILDMRYNGGGYVYTEEILASMLAPIDMVRNGEVYQTEIWNNKYMAYFTQNKIDRTLYFKTLHKGILNGKELTYNTAEANIGLEKIYALISSGTASASEGIIVGLLPYMDIELIGKNSSGKYCTGSIFQPKDIYKKAPDAIKNWGIYVMVNRYGDRNGNNPCMPDGLVPNFTANDDPMDGYQLGDEQEGLLKIALQHAGMKFDEQTTRTHSYPDVELTMIDTNPLSGKRIQLNTAMPTMVSIPTTTGM